MALNQFFLFRLETSIKQKNIYLTQSIHERYSLPLLEDWIMIPSQKYPVKVFLFSYQKYINLSHRYTLFMCLSGGWGVLSRSSVAVWNNSHTIKLDSAPFISPCLFHILKIRSRQGLQFQDLCEAWKSIIIYSSLYFTMCFLDFPQKADDPSWKVILLHKTYSQSPHIHSHTLPWRVIPRVAVLRSYHHLSLHIAVGKHGVFWKLVSTYKTMSLWLWASHPVTPPLFVPQCGCGKNWSLHNTQHCPGKNEIRGSCRCLPDCQNVKNTTTSHGTDRGEKNPHEPNNKSY